MKKILIIGGSYFFGRVFTETLRAKGDYEISVLNRGRIPFRETDIKQLICDRHDEARLARLLKPGAWDAVVDFCAYSAFDINGLFDSLSRGACGRYILISTASVYADQAPAVPLTEDAPLLKSRLKDTEDYKGYVWNKRLAEAEAVRRTEEYGAALTVLRPAIIYGKYNYAPRESTFFDRIIEGKDLLIPEPVDAGGAARYSFVSVWDAAALAAECLENEGTAGRCFNLAAPQKISYRSFAEAAAAAVQSASGFSPEITEMPPSRIEEEGGPLPFPPDRNLLYSGDLIAAALGLGYSGFGAEMERSWKYYCAGRGIDPAAIKGAG